MPNNPNRLGERPKMPTRDLNRVLEVSALCLAIAGNNLANIYDSKIADLEAHIASYPGRPDIQDSLIDDFEARHPVPRRRQIDVPVK